MDFKRRSGVLLHPTSLPGNEGIGTLGKNAFAFINWLKSANQTLWQVLPLGPTGYGDSPYASFSTFAGNPLLIDLEDLSERGWCAEEDIIPPKSIKKEGNVDYGTVVWWKMPVLKRAAAYFLENAPKEDLATYKKFCTEKKEWLDMFATFMSIKEYYDAKAQEERPASSLWNVYWPKPLARCEEDAVLEWQHKHKKDIEIFKVIQFFFDAQWQAVKEMANEKGILIIGDIPIFVAPDSADVWANQSLFQLGEDGRPSAVAGVPPDYFSADGQLWGNPLYDWDAMKADGYSWWIKRIQRVLELTDILRIDHFRGFESYWAVPAGEKTAVNGTWKKGPGIDLFNAVKEELGDIPVIAEDLGVITDEVRKLRDDCGFPGMKVLQFAFDRSYFGENGMTHYFMPHMFDTPNCVVYTGTHDNDTLQAWLENLCEDDLVVVGRYAGGRALRDWQFRSRLKSGGIRRDLICTAFSSTAVYAIFPMQDLIGVGNEGRMNMPSTTGSNWTWRMREKDFRKVDVNDLYFLSVIYGRN